MLLETSLRRGAIRRNKLKSRGRSITHSSDIRANGRQPGTKSPRSQTHESRQSNFLYEYVFERVYGLHAPSPEPAILLGVRRRLGARSKNYFLPFVGVGAFPIFVVMPRPIAWSCSSPCLACAPIGPFGSRSMAF